MDSIGLLICRVFAGLLWAVSCISQMLERYRVKQYTGDGAITDRGPLAFEPRYKVVYPAISLAERGRYSFTGSGFPPIHAGLSFSSIPPFPRENSLGLIEQVSRLPVVIGVVMVDDDGTSILQFAAPIQKWRCSSEGKIWHHECTHIRLDSKRRYRLTVDVECLSADTLNLSVLPCLSGGGLPPV